MVRCRLAALTSIVVISGCFPPKYWLATTCIATQKPIFVESLFIRRCGLPRMAAFGLTGPKAPERALFHGMGVNFELEYRNHLPTCRAFQTPPFEHLFFFKQKTAYEIIP